jgi:GntR family transcriptional regulator
MADSLYRGAALFGSRLADSDPAPLYLRLQKRIREAIRNDELKPFDALPGEREIAEAFGVSRVTVRKALSGLDAPGLLQQRQGSGTFVAPPPHKVEQPLSLLTSFTEDMLLRGQKPTTEWLGREVSLPSPAESMHLLLSPSEPVCRLRRLRLADGAPMAIEHATVPARYLPDPHLVEQSLYAVLEARGVRPVRALQRLRAANLAAGHAGLLGVPPGAAALAIERISFLDTNQPIEFTMSWYRGDAYDFVAELNLKSGP